MKEYTKQDIENVTQLNSRLIQFYTKEKVITSPIGGGGKRGKSWRYSQQNCLEFMIIKALADCDVKVNTIRKVMNELRKWVFFNYFEANGNLKVENPLMQKGYYRNFVIIYDRFEKEEDVQIIRTGEELFKKNGGIPSPFSMKNRKNVLIFDVTDEFLSLVK